MTEQRVGYRLNGDVTGVRDTGLHYDNVYKSAEDNASNNDRHIGDVSVRGQYTGVRYSS